MVVVPLPAQVDFVFAAWISQGMKSDFGPIAKLVPLRNIDGEGGIYIVFVF